MKSITIAHLKTYNNDDTQERKATGKLRTKLKLGKEIYNEEEPFSLRLGL